MVSGKSTGIAKYDKKRVQKKFVKFEREVFYGNFSGGDSKPTIEQIERRKIREEREQALNDRKYERRHRGGYNKTKKGMKT
mgnify:FL=1